MTYDELKEIDPRIDELLDRNFKGKDISGNQYGHLTALYPTVERYHRSPVWACQCDCGNIVYSCIRVLQQGHRKQCDNHEINEMIGKKFGELTVLSYSRTKDDLRYYNCICDCGRTCEVCGKSMKSGHTSTCGNHFVGKDITGQRFGLVTALYPTDEREFGSVVWHCICDCGEEFNSSIKTLRDGKRVQCDNHFKNTLIGKTFGELTVKQYTKTENNKSYFLCSCSCGGSTEVIGSSLISGYTQSCGHLKSIGENNIRKLLDDNGKSYIQQITFETCRFPDTNMLAKFDFYVIAEDCFLLEFDGPQHKLDYESNEIFSAEDLITIRNHDLYKNQWAYENDVPIKRIPYEFRDTITIDDIFSDRFLITPETHPFCFPQNNSSYPYYSINNQLT